MSNGCVGGHSKCRAQGAADETDLTNRHDFFLATNDANKSSPSRSALKIAEAYEQGNLMTARRRSKMCNVKTQSTGDEANVKREPLKGRRTSKKPARQIVVQMDRSEEILSTAPALAPTTAELRATAEAAFKPKPATKAPDAQRRPKQNSHGPIGRGC